MKGKMSTMKERRKNYRKLKMDCKEPQMMLWGIT
jgi:hypothetical protein